MSDTKKPLKRDKANRVVCTVMYTKEQIDPVEEQALQKLGKNVKIEGFRPGKAPLEMLRKQVNPDELLEETIHMLLPETIRSLVQENEIQPIIPPKIEAKNREPLTLVITFTERPTVAVKEAAKIRVEKKESKVDDKDVNKTIGHVLSQYQTTKSVERAAKDGDRITMDFWGEDSQGTEVKGTRTKEHQIVIGSAVLIPGFEEELKGLKSGEEKTFTITFPQEYHAKELQGKPVTFHVTVTKVEEVEVPALTDAFAKEHFQAESATAFREKVRDSMVTQEERVEQQRRENELFDKIRSATVVEIAEELVNEEERDILEQFSRQLSQHNVTMEDWLKRSQKKAEDFQKEIHQQAKEKLTLRLGIQHLVEERDIIITDEELDTVVEELLTTLSAEERAKAEPMYRKGNQGWMQLQWQKRVEKLIEEMLK
ncbi:MAG: trigger factor [Candidatus Peribacteraceae bacterium]|jgi:trigger factor